MSISHEDIAKYVDGLPTNTLKRLPDSPQRESALRHIELATNAAHECVEAHEASQKIGAT
jgi:hypothetical protein